MSATDQLWRSRGAKNNELIYIYWESTFEIITPFFRMQEKRCLNIRFHLSMSLGLHSIAMGQTEASHLWWHSRASSSTQLPATKDEEFTHFRLPAPNAAFEKLKLQAGCLLKRWLHAAEWFAAFHSIYSLLSHSNYFFLTINPTITSTKSEPLGVEPS